MVEIHNIKILVTTVGEKILEKMREHPVSTVDKKQQPATAAASLMGAFLGFYIILPPKCLLSDTASSCKKMCVELGGGV